MLAPNLGWRDVDLKTPVESAIGIPVEMENAANACALAEASFGEHGGVRDLIAVTVSEGIGTGIISDGRLIRGAAGMAGEFGHVCLDERGPVCKCGQRGCWEVFASNSAAVAYYVRAARGRSRSPGKKPAPRPSFEDLLVLAQQGDCRAVEALERMARYLGDGIAMLATGLAPSRILVVGEVTRAWERVGRSSASERQRGCPPPFRRSCPQVMAARPGSAAPWRWCFRNTSERRWSPDDRGYGVDAIIPDDRWADPEDARAPFRND